MVKLDAEWFLSAGNIEQVKFWESFKAVETWASHKELSRFLLRVLEGAKEGSLHYQAYTAFQALIGSTLSEVIPTYNPIWTAIEDIEETDRPALIGLVARFLPLFSSPYPKRTHELLSYWTTHRNADVASTAHLALGLLLLDETLVKEPFDLNQLSEDLEIASEHFRNGFEFADYRPDSEQYYWISRMLIAAIEKLDSDMKGCFEKARLAISERSLTDGKESYFQLELAIFSKFETLAVGLQKGLETKKSYDLGKLFREIIELRYKLIAETLGKDIIGSQFSGRLAKNLEKGILTPLLKTYLPSVKQPLAAFIKDHSDDTHFQYLSSLYDELGRETGLSDNSLIALTKRFPDLTPEIIREVKVAPNKEEAFRILLSGIPAFTYKPEGSQSKYLKEKKSIPKPKSLKSFKWIDSHLDSEYKKIIALSKALKEHHFISKDTKDSDFARIFLKKIVIRPVNWIGRGSKGECIFFMHLLWMEFNKVEYPGDERWEVFFRCFLLNGKSPIGDLSVEEAISQKLHRTFAKDHNKYINEAKMDGRKKSLKEIVELVINPES